MIYLILKSIIDQNWFGFKNWIIKTNLDEKYLIKIDFDVQNCVKVLLMQSWSILF